MKFSELNPKISATDISFDCPKCGPPYRIGIAARYMKEAKEGTWCWSAPLDGAGGYDAITITPSISNQNHGKKKSCGYHCSITNGEVLP